MKVLSLMLSRDSQCGLMVENWSCLWPYQLRSCLDVLGFKKRKNDRNHLGWAPAVSSCVPWIQPLKDVGKHREDLCCDGSSETLGCVEFQQWNLWNNTEMGVREWAYRMNDVLMTECPPAWWICLVSGWLINTLTDFSWSVLVCDARVGTLLLVTQDER